MTIIRVTDMDASECTCPNRHPHLDEFVATNVDFHFEAMNDSQFWMMVTDRDTGAEWHINCGAVNTRARGYCTAEEDSYGGQCVKGDV